MALAEAATSLAGAQLLKRAKWSWFAYGAAAYVGLRLMRRYGIFEKQADQAIGLIDRTIGRKVGAVQSEQTVH